MGKAKIKHNLPKDEVTTISEDYFFEHYNPVVNNVVRMNTSANIADSEICSWSGCMYETYGTELDYIIASSNNPSMRNKVWTIIEVDNDKTIIMAGFHIVDRMGYLITEKPWVTGLEEVVIDTEID